MRHCWLKSVFKCKCLNINMPECSLGQIHRAVVPPSYEPKQDYNLHQMTTKIQKFKFL